MNKKAINIIKEIIYDFQDYMEMDDYLDTYLTPYVENLKIVLKELEGEKYET